MTYPMTYHISGMMKNKPGFDTNNKQQAKQLTMCVAHKL